MAQTLRVVGRNLPHSVQLELAWSADGKTSPVQTLTYTDKRGALNTSMHVPASPPGRYQITAIEDGVPQASAIYLVRSLATLGASIDTNRRGTRLALTGHKFPSGERVVCLAVPFTGGQRTRLLGFARSDGAGSFRFTTARISLPPGEYEVKAYSSDQMSALLAQSFFEVTS